ncbi:MAG: hypothetical protein AAFU80_19990 [Pseudomonadota bacterium]
MSDPMKGYDLMFAVSELTLNAQFELLSVTGVLPARWTVPPNDEGYSIDVELGMPKLRLFTPSGDNSSADLIVPLSSGSMTLMTLSHGEAVPVQHDVSGWYLVLHQDLAIAEIAAADAAAHKAVPDSVQTMLKHFDANDFSVQHVFMDMENVDFSNEKGAFSLLPDKGAGPDTGSPMILMQLNALVQSLVNSLKGSNNPFIFGYQAVDKVESKSKASFTPVSATFTKYAVEAVERRALVFLCVTEGKAPPAVDVDLGYDPIQSHDVQASMTVDFKVVANFLLPPIADAGGFDVSKARITDNVASMSKANNYNGSVRMELSPLTNASTMRATFQSDYHDVTIKDKLGTKIGTIEGVMEWFVDFNFAVDDKGKVSIATSHSSKVQDLHHKAKENTMGKIEGWLASVADELTKLLTFEQESGGFNDMVKHDWSKEVSVPLAAKFNDVSMNFVLPAGNILFFKDALFDSAGNLRIDATYKD